MEGQPSAFNLPPSLGTIDEFHSSSAPFIFYIQDAHDSLEAQENIAKIIHHLVKTAGIKTVFEEGYEGEVPTDQYFSGIKDSKIRRKISYYLMDQLRIGGAEYAHINRKADFKLIGADSFELRKKNSRWFQKTAKEQKQVDRDLRAMEKKLDLIIQRNFPRELKAWMARKEKLGKNELDLWNYMQQSMDPELAQSKLTSGQFFIALAKWEQEFAASHLKSERDRQAFHYYQVLQLLKRLNHLEVTAAEYQSIQQEIKSFNTQELARFIVKYTGKTLVLSKRWEKNIRNAIGFYETARERDGVIEKVLSSRFKVQSSRFKVQGSKLKGTKTLNFELGTLNSDNAILVYGGFHKDRIKEILIRQGFSYAIISPKITHLSKRHEDLYARLLKLGMNRASLPQALTRAFRAFSDFEMSTQAGKGFDLKANIETLRKAALETQGTEWLQSMDLVLKRAETRNGHSEKTETLYRPEVISRLREFIYEDAALEERYQIHLQLDRDGAARNFSVAAYERNFGGLISQIKDALISEMTEPYAMNIEGRTLTIFSQQSTPELMKVKQLLERKRVGAAPQPLTGVEKTSLTPIDWTKRANGNEKRQLVKRAVYLLQKKNNRRFIPSALVADAMSIPQRRLTKFFINQKQDPFGEDVLSDNFLTVKSTAKKIKLILADLRLSPHEIVLLHELEEYLGRAHGTLYISLKKRITSDPYEYLAGLGVFTKHALKSTHEQRKLWAQEWLKENKITETPELLELAMRITPLGEAHKLANPGDDRIWKYHQSYVREFKRNPTLHEMAEAFEMSRPTMRKHLNAIEQRRHLKLNTKISNKIDPAELKHFSDLLVQAARFASQGQKDFLRVGMELGTRIRENLEQYGALNALRNAAPVINEGIRIYQKERGLLSPNEERELKALQELFQWRKKTLPERSELRSEKRSDSKLLKALKSENVFEQFLALENYSGELSDEAIWEIAQAAMSSNWPEFKVLAIRSLVNNSYYDQQVKLIHSLLLLHDSPFTPAIPVVIKILGHWSKSNFPDHALIRNTLLQLLQKNFEELYKWNAEPSIMKGELQRLMARHIRTPEDKQKALSFILRPAIQLYLDSENQKDISPINYWPLFKEFSRSKWLDAVKIYKTLEDLREEHRAAALYFLAPYFQHIAQPYVREDRFDIENKIFSLLPPDQEGYDSSPTFTAPTAHPVLPNGLAIQWIPGRFRRVPYESTKIMEGVLPGARVLAFFADERHTRLKGITVINHVLDAAFYARYYDRKTEDKKIRVVADIQNDSYREYREEDYPVVRELFKDWSPMMRLILEYDARRQGIHQLILPTRETITERWPKIHPSLADLVYERNLRRMGYHKKKLNVEFENEITGTRLWWVKDLRRKDPFTPTLESYFTPERPEDFKSLIEEVSAKTDKTKPKLSETKAPEIPKSEWSFKWQSETTQTRLNPFEDELLIFLNGKYYSELPVAWDEKKQNAITPGFPFYHSQFDRLQFRLMPDVLKELSRRLAEKGFKHLHYLSADRPLDEHSYHELKNSLNVVNSHHVDIDLRKLHPTSFFQKPYPYILIPFFIDQITQAAAAFLPLSWPAVSDPVFLPFMDTFHPAFRLLLLAPIFLVFKWLQVYFRADHTRSLFEKGVIPLRILVGLSLSVGISKSWSFLFYGGEMNWLKPADFMAPTNLSTLVYQILFAGLGIFALYQVPQMAVKQAQDILKIKWGTRSEGRKKKSKADGSWTSIPELYGALDTLLGLEEQPKKAQKQRLEKINIFLRLLRNQKQLEEFLLLYLNGEKWELRSTLISIQISMWEWFLENRESLNAFLSNDPETLSLLEEWRKKGRPSSVASIRNRAEMRLWKKAAILISLVGLFAAEEATRYGWNAYAHPNPATTYLALGLHSGREPVEIIEPFFDEAIVRAPRAFLWRPNVIPLFERATDIPIRIIDSENKEITPFSLLGQWRDQIPASFNLDQILFSMLQKYRSDPEFKKAADDYRMRKMMSPTSLHSVKDKYQSKDMGTDIFMNAQLDYFKSRGINSTAFEHGSFESDVLGLIGLDRQSLQSAIYYGHASVALDLFLERNQIMDETVLLRDQLLNAQIKALRKKYPGATILHFRGAGHQQNMPILTEGLDPFVISPFPAQWLKKHYDTSYWNAPDLDPVEREKRKSAAFITAAISQRLMADQGDMIMAALEQEFAGFTTVEEVVQWREDWVTQVSNKAMKMGEMSQKILEDAFKEVLEEKQSQQDVRRSEMRAIPHLWNSMEQLYASLDILTGFKSNKKMLSENKKEQQREIFLQLLKNQLQIRELIAIENENRKDEILWTLKSIRNVMMVWFHANQESVLSFLTQDPLMLEILQQWYEGKSPKPEPSAVQDSPVILAEEPTQPDWWRNLPEFKKENQRRTSGTGSGYEAALIAAGKLEAFATVFEERYRAHYGMMKRVWADFKIDPRSAGKLLRVLTKQGVDPKKISLQPGDLLKGLGEGRDKADVLREFEAKKWNLSLFQKDSFGEQLYAYADLIRGLGIEEEFKQKMRELYQGYRGVTAALSRHFGVTDPTILELIETFAISFTDIILKDGNLLPVLGLNEGEVLILLKSKRWNLNETLQELRKSHPALPRLSFQEFIRGLNKVEEFQAEAKRLYIGYGGIIKSVAKRFGVSDEVLLDLFRDLAVKTGGVKLSAGHFLTVLEKSSEEIQALAESENWSLSGLNKKLRGLDPAFPSVSHKELLFGLNLEKAFVQKVRELYGAYGSTDRIATHLGLDKEGFYHLVRDFKIDFSAIDIQEGHYLNLPNFDKPQILNLMERNHWNLRTALTELQSLHPKFPPAPPAAFINGLGIQTEFETVLNQRYEQNHFKLAPTMHTFGLESFGSYHSFLRNLGIQLKTPSNGAKRSDRKIPAGVFLDAEELASLEPHRAEARLQELTVLLAQHPAFDIYIDKADRYPIHNIQNPTLQAMLKDFSNRVHLGMLDRARLREKKIVIQVSFFDDRWTESKTAKTLQELKTRYKIETELQPLEYTQAGALIGFMDLLESKADSLREQVSEAFATFASNGRWRMAEDYLTSVWTQIQNATVIQFSA